MSTQPEHAHFVIPAWTFGDRLRKARGAVHLDQRAFAEHIGVAPGSLAAWETDRAKPRDLVTVARRVELLTRIPATWLLGLETGNPRQDGPGGGEGLPRLDSNQQPSGYTDSQVSAADVVDFEGYRERRGVPCEDPLELEPAA